MLRSIYFLLIVCLTGLSAAHGAPAVITDRLYHLGTSQKPEWKEFTTAEPHHRNLLELEFQATKGAADYALEIQSGEVGYDYWRIRLNDEPLGALRKSEDITTQYFRVPPAAVKDGTNRLRVSSFFGFGRRGGGAGTTDDIYVGKAVLHDRSMRDVAGYARVTVRVRDPDSAQGLPCRLTIVKPGEKKDDKGKVTATEDLVDVIPVDENEVALRKGIVYTKKGLAAFDVVAGKYTLYATRGFEYGLAVARLDLSRFEEKPLDLELRREVDTTGLLAADTHVHTRTYSGHGDIELEDRVITIAGEGVELAVATDHNHHTDYRRAMEDAGMKEDFVPIIGNEVTTTWGHFNAFPLKRDEAPPDHDHSDWTNLIKAMRASSGVRVLIVNHPRRTLTNASTFGHISLNALSGEAHRGPASLGIDAVEVVNGKTLEEDSMLTLKDWFGMLNRGHRVAAVAGSDSHAVSEVVGQARTYVASSSDDPRKIKIDELCDAFIAGRLLVSLGLLTQVAVNRKHGPGDLATGLGQEIEVKVKVQGPSWTRADSVALYLNGTEARREKIEPTEKPVKHEAVWRIRRPAHDAHLVVVATGPPVTAPYWPMSGGEKAYVLGATNTVWLDADGDGKFTSAREYAVQLVGAHGLRGEKTMEALRVHDAAVLAQFGSLARASVQAELQAGYEKLLAESDARLAELLACEDPALKKGLGDYVAAGPKLDVTTRTSLAEKAAVLKKEEEDRKKRKEEERKRRERESAQGGRRQRT